MRLFSVSAFLALAALAPTMAIGDDHQIAKSILQKLSVQKEAGNLVGFNVQLQVEEGVVKLKGHVSKPAQEQLVIDIARREAGVKKVVEAVEVAQAPAKATQPAAAPTGLSQPKQLRKQMGPVSVAGKVEPLADAEYGQKSSDFKPVEVKPVALTQPAEEAVTPSPAAPVQPRLAYSPQGDVKLPEVKAQPPVVNAKPVQPRMAYSPQGEVELPKVSAAPIQLPAPPQQQIRVTQYTGHPAGTPAAPAPQYAPPQPVQQRVAQAPAYAQQRIAQYQGHPAASYGNRPVPFAPAAYSQQVQGGPPVRQAAYPTGAYVPNGGQMTPAQYDHPNLPNYAWPAYAAHPNYSAVTYPKQYSPTAWPYIGPFHPYPQVPLGWRKVTLEWDDGWWFLDFNDH